MVKQGAKTVVPRLRFPGFDSPWANDPLSKVLTEHKLKNTEGRDVFSVSMESGIVNQIEHLGRSFAASDTANYNLGHRFDLVYTKSPLKAFPFGIVKQCKFDGDVALSPLYGVFTPESPHVGLIIEAYFEAPSRSIAFLSPLCQKGAKNTIQIANTTFLSGRLPLPKEHGEQKKIANCLTSLDELIAAQGRKLEALKSHKRGLMQQLFPREGETRPRFRFRKFHNAAEWKRATVRTLISTITPPRKIPTSGYGAEGLLPIIDQSPDPICGWTNDLDAKVDARCPLIIFGDHTCVLKLVEHDFAQGADGIKIISARPHIDTRFLYFALQADPITSASYRRHFSLLQEKHIAFPEGLKEQQHIASCLSLLEIQITAESTRLSVLKTHKQGLMQQLFPAPEFASA